MRALFLARLEEEKREAFETDETLSARLDAMIDTAKAALGTFKITEEDYVEHLASVVPKGGTPEAFAKLRAADLYLACACAAGDDHARRPARAPGRGAGFLRCRGARPA